MISAVDIGRLAGILEGEGAFTHSKVGEPCVKLSSTDLDVVEWVAQITNTSVFGPYNPGGSFIGKRPVYRCQVRGNRGASLMMMLYPLMFSRRKQRIKELLAEWRLRPAKPGHIGRTWRYAMVRFTPHTAFSSCHPARPNKGYGLCNACYQHRRKERHDAIVQRLAI